MDAHIDNTSLEWYKALVKVRMAAKPTIAIPQKYFDILKTWGFAAGTPAEARLGEKSPPRDWLEPKKQARKGRRK